MGYALYLILLTLLFAAWVWLMPELSQAPHPTLREKALSWPILLLFHQREPKYHLRERIGLGLLYLLMALAPMLSRVLDNSAA